MQTTALIPQPPQCLPQIRVPRPNEVPPLPGAPRDLNHGLLDAAVGVRTRRNGERSPTEPPASSANWPDVVHAHAALREGGRRGQEAGGRPLFDAAFLPAQLGFAIVLISIRVGSRRRGVLLTPSTIPLILIGAGLFTPTLGLWSDSRSLTAVLAGAAFLIAAIGVAAYLAPRAVLLLTQSGATPALRRTILWPEVSGLVVSPNGASLLPSKVVVAVTQTGAGCCTRLLAIRFEP